MKVYLDYIFLINFLFDFILLLGTSLVLKRKISRLRLFLGSLFGAFSFFIIFLSISSFLFFLIKMIFALIMIIITFSYKSFSYTMNNFFFLIILSILMGGFLYLIDIEAGYSHIGMVFFTNEKKLNTLLLIIFGFILTIVYYFYMKKFKLDNSTNYNCKLKLNDKTFTLNGYLDTGNTLLYFNKPVVILNKDIASFKTYLLIPFNTLRGSGVLKGFYANLEIKELGYFKKIVVALSNDKFSLNGADIILNNRLREEKYENTKFIKKIIEKK